MTPRELRTLAVQARHCDVPTIADALDASAERIEELAAVVRIYMGEDDRAAGQIWGDGQECACPTCVRAREALGEVGR